jgi:cytochrome c oxidase assembly protein Cox11
MLALLGSLLAVMTGLVAYAPTLYQIFCAATGCGTRPDERIGNARRQPEAQPA